jgi:hypothetical protein
MKRQEMIDFLEDMAAEEREAIDTLDEESADYDEGLCKKLDYIADFIRDLPDRIFPLEPPMGE